MQVKLGNIANIQFGYYAKPVENGTIPYLMAKHFNAYGQYIGDDDTFLAENDKNNNALLEDGDILFTSKGFRFFATSYKAAFGKAIASSVFYIIKANRNLINPDYLVTVLNQPKSLLYFHQAGAGSTIPSIRKSELMDFTFNLLQLQQQEAVVNLQQLYLRDIALTENLMKEKDKLFQTAINKLIIENE